MPKKKEEKLFEIKSFSFAEMDMLMKLRLIVISIFALCTLSIFLIFVTDFVIPATLLVISYIIVFALMVKLLVIKKL